MEEVERNEFNRTLQECQAFCIAAGIPGAIEPRKSYNLLDGRIELPTWDGSLSSVRWVIGPRDEALCTQHQPFTPRSRYFVDHDAVTRLLYSDPSK